MRPSFAVACVALIASSLTSAVSLAEEAEPPKRAPSGSVFERKPTAVFATVAPFGSPVGHLGIEVERTLVSFLAVNGGVGLGVSGPQLAAGLRARAIGGERWAASLGTGLSAGKWEPFCFGLEYCPEKRTALWTNVEAAYEARFHNGVSLRFALGASLGTACWGAQECSRQSQPRLSDVLPYHTVSVGYAW